MAVIPPPDIFPHVLVVQASAGAGKTYSLSLRFLQLLALAPRPSPEALRQVMALTFTVAAAQEMRSRIIAFLKEIALDTDQGRILQEQARMQPDVAAAWLDCILNHFQGFQVKTIDSLHFQIVQALGRRMQLWPELETSFDRSHWAKLMLASLLARTDWDTPHPPLQASEDDTLLALWESIFSLYLHLQERPGVRFLNWLEHQAMQVFSGLDQVIAPLQRTSLDQCKMRQTTFERQFAMFWRVLAECGLDNQVSRFRKDKITIDSKFFARTRPEDLFKKAAHAHPALLSAWGEYQRLCDVRDAFLLEQARLRMEPLVRLHDLLFRETERLGRSQGLLLGGWWTRLIRQHMASEDLLLEAEMVLNAKWRHVLIDEFQDTSREQWEVLQKLAEESLSQGGSLFCVGDVKQAIYGWRGGDWRLFFEPLKPEVFRSVEEHGRQQAALPYNRRSCVDIVQFNNECFSPLGSLEHAGQVAASMVRGTDADLIRDLLRQSISTLYQDAEQLPWLSCNGRVHFTSLQAENQEAYQTLALNTLLGLVLDLQEQGVGLGDIAVLVRTNAEAGACARVLLGQGLPTVTEQSLRIGGHPHVRGLLALLAWLDDPLDEAAFYALCISPLLADAKIDMPGMIRAVRANQCAGITTLSQALRDQQPQLWTRLLHPLATRVEFSGAYDLLLAAVEHFSLRSLDLGEWAWVEKLLEAAWSAELEGVQSISAFLQFWRQKGDECVVGLPEGLDAVRVLTMHKAKGLEFPRVILPLLQYAPKNRTSYHVLHTPLGEPFLAAANKPRAREVAAAHDQETAKIMVEELNLLYVAMTRAKEHLHLFLANVATTSGARATDWLRTLNPDALQSVAAPHET